MLMLMLMLMLSLTIPQFFTLAEIVMVMVAGSVEDERSFLAMNFLKSDDRNSLDKHVELCMRLKLQKLFTLASFPFPEAYAVWKAPGRYGLA